MMLPRAVLAGGRCFHPFTPNSAKAAAVSVAPGDTSFPAHAPSEPNLSQCRRQCPKSYYVNPPAPGKHPTLHVITVLNPSEPIVEKDKYIPATIDIKLETSTSDQILSLSCSDAVIWKVNAPPGAKLKKVILSGIGLGRTQVVGVDPKLVVRLAMSGKISTGWERENLAGGTLDDFLNPIRAAAGTNETSFMGMLTATSLSVPFYQKLSELAEREAPYQKRNRKQVLENPNGKVLLLSNSTAKTMDLRSSVGGPAIKGAQMTRYPIGYAIDEKTKEVYQLVDDGLWNMNTGQLAKTPLEIGNLQAVPNIAFDSKRRRFVIFAARDGVFALTFEPDTYVWKKLPENPLRRAYGQIVYSSSEDVFYAMPFTFGSYKFSEIYVLSAELKPLRTIFLSKEILHTPHGLLHLDYFDHNIIFINNPNEDNPKFQIVAIDPACGETQVIR